MGAIDDYLAELARALRGPGRAKADLLTEARHGLVDAADALERGGLNRADAQRRAVADFGPVIQVAPDFQRELCALQSRRTAVLVALVLAPQHLIWESAGLLGVRDPGWSPGPGYAALSGLVEWLGAIGLAVAVMAVLAVGVGARTGRLGWLTAWITGVVAAIVAPTLAVCGLLLTLWGPVPPFSLTGLPWVTAFLLMPMVWVAVSARRCLAAA